MSKAVMDCEHVHTALCIWETWLESEGDTPWTLFRDAHGAVHSRYAAIHMAPQVEAVWTALDDETRDCVCYDWEFVPTMLQHFTYGPRDFPRLDDTVEAVAAEVVEYYATLRNHLCSTLPHP